MAEEKSYKALSLPWRIFFRVSIWLQVIIFIACVLFGWLIIQMVRGIGGLFDYFTQITGGYLFPQWRLLAGLLLGIFASGQAWDMVSKTLKEIGEKTNGRAEADTQAR